MSFETQMPRSFEDILSLPVEEVKVPIPLPPGQYLAMVGDHEVTKKGKKETPCVVLKVQLMQALDQTPAFQQSLVDVLNGKPLMDVPISYTLWLTSDAAFRLKIFLLDHLGIEAGTLKEALAYSRGKQFVATIAQYPITRDGEDPRVGMEIKSTSKAG
jgi:hypothetical protein